jgi:hypothetical protein
MTVILPEMIVGFKKELGRSSPYKKMVLVVSRPWGMAVVIVVVVPFPTIEFILFSGPNCERTESVPFTLPLYCTNEN